MAAAALIVACVGPSNAPPLEDRLARVGPTQTEGAGPEAVERASSTPASGDQTDPRSTAGPARDSPSASVDVFGGDEAAVSCERVCGQVNDCLRAQGESGAEAASVERGCLGGCVDASGAARGALVDCGGRVGCPELLACVEVAWIEPTSAGLAEPESAVEGCPLICSMLREQCNNESTPEEVAECTRRCRRSLDREAEAELAGCATFEGSCDELISCVMSFPGA